MKDERATRVAPRLAVRRLPRIEVVEGIEAPYEERERDAA
jgi:hypothetical protein